MLAFFVFRIAGTIFMDIEKTINDILSDPLRGIGYNLIRTKMIGSNKLQICVKSPRMPGFRLIPKIG